MCRDPGALRHYESLLGRAFEYLAFLKVGSFWMLAVQQRGCDPNFVGNGHDRKGWHSSLAAIYADITLD
jgi:hypothetical protein